MGGLTDTFVQRSPALQPTVPAKHFPDTPAPEADHEDQGQAVGENTWLSV